MKLVGAGKIEMRHTVYLIANVCFAGLTFNFLVKTGNFQIALDILYLPPLLPFQIISLAITFATVRIESAHFMEKEPFLRKEFDVHLLT